MKQTQKAAFPIKVVIFTAVLTLAISAAAAYFLGYLSWTEKENRRATEAQPADERKIAYWQAPMNPTEIYDQPGKSAMGMDLVPVYEDEVGDSTGAGPAERRIAYWRAPMNPTEIYDQPGKSAMDMDLVPVYEDELIGGVEVSIDPVTQQNMGVRTAVVKKEALTHVIRTYGHVTPDETSTVQISLKTDGWIEKLHVDFTGKFVAKGEPLFEIYSPSLLAAQEELLVTLRSQERSQNQMNREMVDSARRRLQYFDLAAEEIDRLVKKGAVSKTVTIRSPFSGYVIKKQVEEGVYVKAGTMVFQIADLSRVWVEAHIYEYELPWIAQGQEAEISLAYLPGRKFSGKVAYVYPYLQPKTRDVVIRLEFENPDLQLKPDMYADVRIKTHADEEGLVIPAESVIHSGERNVVFVTRGGNKFSPRDVTLGLTVDGGKVQVLSGLAPGDMVVTSGQFLIDSESKLKEAVQKMLEAKREKRVKAAAPEDRDEGFFDEMEEDEDFFRDMEEE